jgi:hypothetical protein
MTPGQRLHAAKAEITDLLTLTTPGSHDHQVLQLHAHVLNHVDPWLLGRLGRGGLLTELVRNLLDLYSPLEPTQTAATPQTQEAHS